MNILGMDPGSQTTGFFIYSTAAGPEHFQLDPDAAFQELYCGGGFLAIVVEKYRPKGTSDPLPAELNGAARMAAMHEAAQYVEVTPADAKTMAPDDLLKNLGWYRADLPHANDAARLVVHYIVTKLRSPDPLHDYVVNTKLAGRL